MEKYICFGLANENHKHKNSPNFYTNVPFGERKGETVDNVIESDLKKIFWFIKNEDYKNRICLSEDALEKTKSVLSHF